MNRLIIQFGRSNIILGLIVAMGLVFGYMTYSSADDPTAALSLNEVAVKDDFQSFKNLKIDFSILDDERYRSLEVYGENPVDPKITGEKDNPFAPLSNK